MHIIDVIDNVEAHGVTLLDAHERTAVVAYQAAIDGIEGALDSLDAAAFLELEHEFGTDTAQAQVRGHFATLTTWYGALDYLYTDLATGPTQKHSEVARQLVQGEANRFFHTLNLLRREVCTWLLGTAGPRPEIDAGVLTFCDIPPRIHLDGTALAESG